MIRALIVHEVYLVADLLTKALSNQADITVVGRAISPEHALTDSEAIRWRRTADRPPTSGVD